MGWCPHLDMGEMRRTMRDKVGWKTLDVLDQRKDAKYGTSKFLVRAKTKPSQEVFELGGVTVQVTPADQRTLDATQSGDAIADFSEDEGGGVAASSNEPAAKRRKTIKDAMIKRAQHFGSWQRVQ